jgi:hypothetical protein
MLGDEAALDEMRSLCRVKGSTTKDGPTMIAPDNGQGLDVQRCPSCHSFDLRTWTSTDRRVLFVCKRCNMRWHIAERRSSPRRHDAYH